MTYLVTGGCGFVAANLIPHLLTTGKRVLALDNFCRGSEANLGSSRHHPNLTVRQVDLSNLDAYRSAVSDAAGDSAIHEVWHLAANSDIPAGIRDSEVDLRDTFMTTYNTLAVMEERQVSRLFFASSSAVYGDHGDEILTESSGPLLPISNYGAMKLASEAIISAASEKFLTRAALLRFPNVVGVPSTHGVILDFIRRLRSDPAALTVLGDGTQRKCYLHVSDLVDAMLVIRDRSTDKVGAFNIGPEDSGITVAEIAAEVVAAVAPGATITYGSGNKGWVGDVPKFRYSLSRLQALGWHPQHTSLQAIRIAVREIARQEGVECGRR
jgi:UDP-glucose 4-epimerase